MRFIIDVPVADVEMKKDRITVTVFSDFRGEVVVKKYNGDLLTSCNIADPPPEVVAEPATPAEPPPAAEAAAAPVPEAAAAEAPAEPKPEPAAAPVDKPAEAEKPAGT